ncbi:TIGR01459 family HAD-type hydrolase [Rhodovulum sp. YNF3179]|uniref:TIGR01459 family HAD-type hydrolase n=1 Tax=Rhodovulum sp. YNF3179 TaxID=3425127 RepID=UPI003D34DC21
MTRIIERLDDISDRYDALFVDLWGCLHDGYRPFPDAVAALERFKAGGGKVVLLTNSPRPRAAVIRQLEKIGVPRATWDDIASSGDSAQAGMMRGAVGRRVYHMGPPVDESFFTDTADDITDEVGITRVPLTEAEGIVCTGLEDDETETPEDYRAQLLYAKNAGMKLLCANPDIVVDRGDKRIFCAGALAQLYTEMGGKSLYFGKPHPPIYDLARRRLRALDGPVDESRILCMGDGIATDIQGATGENLDSLFISGGLARAETGTDRQPDPGKLEAYLAEAQQSPDYSIGHLR